MEYVFGMITGVSSILCALLFVALLEANKIIAKNKQYLNAKDDIIQSQDSVIKEMLEGGNVLRQYIANDLNAAAEQYVKTQPVVAAALRSEAARIVSSLS